jgi:hypothetical protein
VDDYRDTKAEISGLIEEQTEETPQATKTLSPNSVESVYGLLFRRTNSLVKGLILIRFSSSRCPKWGLVVGWTWSSVCSPAKIFRMLG